MQIVRTAISVAVSCCWVLTLNAQQIMTPQMPPSAPSALIPAPIRDSGKSNATSNVNSADVKTEHAQADRADLPPIVPANRRSIGLALEGGGAIGLAHVGILKWLEDNHIPVDRLAGTSMGALIGSFYASGKTPAEIEKIADSGVFLDIFTVETPYTDVSFRRREDRRELPQAVTIGLKGGLSLRNALVVDSGLNGFLHQVLFRYDSAEVRYDTLPIPFRCVSTDLNTMQPVVFEGGPLSQAIRASISIPGIFSPVEYKNHYLVDGAIMDNLPSDIVRQDLHADVVIGVHLDAPTFTGSDVSSVLSVFARAFAAGTSRNEKLGEKGADILLHVESGSFSAGDYGKAKELIQLGYASAEKQRNSLLKLALNDADWNAYLADRSSRIRPVPGILAALKLEGGTTGAQERVVRDIQPLEGSPMNPGKLTQSLQTVQGNGSYQASYETFNTSNPSPIDRTESQGPDNGLKVRLTPVASGPPFLLFGMDLSASSSNISRSTFDFRLLNTNLGGFGSELRTDVRLGFLTQVSSEYYRMLSPSGYYLQPQVGIFRQPVYLWQNQQRISEHLEQQAGGGLEAGRTFSRNFQMAANYRAQVVRWHPISGDDGTPVLSGTAQTAVAHLSYDTTASGVLSDKGLRLDLKAGALFHAVGSQNAPIFQGQITKSLKFSGANIIRFSGEVNSYFKHSVAEPLRFTMGGPLRLSASSVDEFRGTDVYLAAAVYGRKIATLPSGYGQGLYAGFAYEAAEVWAPQQRAMLRQDGVITLLGVTPVGSVTFGGSIGDAGRRKIFFTFGRLF
jgi:NTE family protein